MSTITSVFLATTTHQVTYLNGVLDNKVLAILNRDYDTLPNSAGTDDSDTSVTELLNSDPVLGSHGTNILTLGVKSGQITSSVTMAFGNVAYVELDGTRVQCTLEYVLEKLSSVDATSLSPVIAQHFSLVIPVPTEDGVELKRYGIDARHPAENTVPDPDLGKMAQILQVLTLDMFEHLTTSQIGFHGYPIVTVSVVEEDDVSRSTGTFHDKPHLPIQKADEATRTAIMRVLPHHELEGIATRLSLPIAGPEGIVYPPENH